MTGRWRTACIALLGLLSFVGLADIVIGGIAAYRFTRSGPALESSNVDHFKYGSIGSEPESGLPYWVWKALPGLFPEVFHGKGFEIFGFLYENDASGKPRDLPIGVRPAAGPGHRGRLAELRGMPHG